MEDLEKVYKEKESQYLEARDEFWEARDEWLKILKVVAALEYLTSKKEV